MASKQHRFGTAQISSEAGSINLELCKGNVILMGMFLNSTSMNTTFVETTLVTTQFLYNDKKNDLAYSSTCSSVDFQV